MGHVRLGTLPKTRAWKDVINLISDGADVAAVADATMRAADKAFEKIQGDKGFAQVVELLTQLAIASKQEVPAQYLDTLGIQLSDNSSIMNVAVELNRAIDQRMLETGRRSDFGELAQNALVGAVVEHLQQRFGPMFAPTSVEIHQAMGDLGKKSQFGQLARTFFGKLTFSATDYFLSMHLGAQIGEDKRFATTNQVAQFQKALNVHCSEAAEIVERFSADWFSKNYFKGDGKISQKKSEGFGWYAMQKMRDEMKIRADHHGS
jgi:hypothetical protein